MKYMILIYGDESGFDKMSGDEAAMREMMAQWGKYTGAMREAGVYRSGAGLMPTRAATTVRVRGARTLSTDGPFAETKEQLGGYYVIEVPDLDEATKWAARCPVAAHGSIELRPVMADAEDN